MGAASENYSLGWQIKTDDFQLRAFVEMTTKSNIIMERIAMCTVISRSSSNSRQKNITGEYVIRIRRTIRTMIKQIYRFLKNR